MHTQASHDAAAAPRSPLLKPPGRRTALAPLSPLFTASAASALLPDRAEHVPVQQSFYAAVAAGEQPQLAYAIRKDGGATVFYPSAALAILRSVSAGLDGALALSTLIYDSDTKHSALGCFDSRGFGSITDPRSGRSFHCIESRGLVVYAANGRQELPAVDSSNGRAIAFPLPFEMKINAAIRVAVDRQQRISLEFSCAGVTASFPIKLDSVRPPPPPQRARPMSLMQGSSSLGALHPATAPSSNKSSASASSVDHSLSSILSDLTALQSRIMTSLSSTAHDPKAQTKAFGTTLKAPQRPSTASAVSYHSRSLGLDVQADSTLDGLQYDREFRARNPSLKRGEAIRNASGKYSIYASVPDRGFKQKALPWLTNSSFESTVVDEEHRGKLVVVFCTAAFVPSCSLYEKQLEQLHASLKPDEPFVMFSFDAAHSRLLIDRYNLRSAPAILMFFNGGLVVARHLGGTPIQHRKRSPVLLLLESSWAEQARIEAAVKTACDGVTAPWQSVLASCYQDLLRYAASPHAPMYDAMLLDLDAHAPQALTMIHTTANRARNAGASSVAAHDGLSNPAPRAPLFVIGVSSRSAAEIRELHLGFAVSSLLPKPLNTRSLAKELQRIYALVAPPLGHTGFDRTDLRNLMQHAYALGMGGRFLSAGFRFAAEIDSSVANISQRIAAKGAISNSVPAAAWVPPPPPPPPPPAPVVEPEPEPKGRVKRSASSAKAAAASAAGKS